MKLRVLVVSDHESEYIWDFFDASVFKGVDVIVSCGDLKAEYLSFLVTMIPAPLLYVRGNHDGRYEQNPPDGCIDLEEKPVVIKGVRFVGFGGCKCSKTEANHYSEREMARRVKKTERLLTIQRKGFDVLVTHAPAADLGDGEDSFHEGFEAFRALIDRFEPRYHLHGHQHLSYSIGSKRIIEYNKTTIVNGYNYYLMEMEFAGQTAQKKPAEKNGVFKRKPVLPVGHGAVKEKT
ncbi:MAG TPA: metallophosphoesterase [Feifaniaceae bacterium]|nr:metallophosphoesterase [Feifaniaceae bacterium]